MVRLMWNGANRKGGGPRKAGGKTTRWARLLGGRDEFGLKKISSCLLG